MSTYLTGDIHGRVDRITNFIEKMKLTEDDIIIILGDVAFNYYGDSSDTKRKKKVAKYAPTIFCIHGNHENRPSNIESYKQKNFMGGTVWYEEAFPNIVFAVDGEVYKIPSCDGTVHDTLICGGAYSVDKFWRIAMHYHWFSDEQPSDEIKKKVERVLETRDWQIDTILTHTGPVSAEPTEMFIKGIDQSKVDKTTEIWFQSILEKLKSFKRWYFGHYHCNKIVDNRIRILFEDFILF